MGLTVISLLKSSLPVDFIVAVTVAFPTVFPYNAVPSFPTEPLAETAISAPRLFNTDCSTPPTVKAAVSPVTNSVLSAVTVKSFNAVLTKPFSVSLSAYSGVLSALFATPAKYLVTFSV